MRTLFVHTGGIGDFIAACPAVAALSAQCEVVLAGQRERLELAVAAGIAKTAHDLDALDFGSVFSTPSARLTAFLADHDRAVVWMRDEDSSIGCALRACGVRDVRCFPGLPGSNWHAPAWRYYLDCLALPDSGPPRLAIPAQAQRNEAILHPGSGGKEKCWGIARFARIAETLAHAGCEVRWCVGPAEENATLRPGAEVLPPLSLVQLARRLAGARAYVGNDSGVTHLAAAVGCPTVAVFGCSDPEVWGPCGAHVRVAGGRAGWPDEEGVLDALRALLHRRKGA